MKQLVFPVAALLALAGCQKQSVEPAASASMSAAASADATVSLACGSFRTYSQGGWGSKARGNNPGAYRDARFAAVLMNGYVNGLVVGLPGQVGRYYMRFETPGAIEDFLPQGGTPAALTGNYEYPFLTPMRQSVLLGQAVALKLNVYYDSAEKSGTSAALLYDLTISRGPFAGLSVGSFLALVERAVGGDPARSVSIDGRSVTFTLAQLNDAATAINENFEDGTANNGFLRCP
ncbi:hypothetical protein LJ737_15625 [Hymenobacter sp. 15J16-1T3B]|uniref:hypothetical protein n=1 Tax=Hymenobacter sp. 15J16-1T3B TaxID=2886941 RepID=UPI001D0FE719|nr:hypothetical protein [Hymenobacter sp. 15J16-1T3B]MCC3158676.1 hypothetical protein [Hymenobacter sp. 15J16-1T3B]